MLLKFSPRFNTIPIKIPTSIFVETDKLILRFIRKFKEYRIVKAILTKNIVGKLTLLNFNTYYKAYFIFIYIYTLLLTIVIQTVMLCKDRPMEQNQVKKQIEWFLTKMPRQFNGKKKVFSKILFNQLNIPILQNIDLYCLPYK